MDDHGPRVPKDGETVVDNGCEHRITWDHLHLGPSTCQRSRSIRGSLQHIPRSTPSFASRPELPRRSWVSRLGAPLLSVGVIIKLASCSDSFLTISLSHTIPTSSHRIYIGGCYINSIDPGQVTSTHAHGPVTRRNGRNGTRTGSRVGSVGIESHKSYDTDLDLTTICYRFTTSLDGSSA